MTRRSLTTFALILALLIVLVASVSLVHDVFTSRIPGANDFFPRWKGAVLFFREGINPYSTQATELIQMDMYGRLAYPDEDQVAFAYPFYTVFLLAPLAIFDISYAMASAIWIVLLLTSIYCGFVAATRLTCLKMPTWLTVIFSIWAIVFYNTVRTLVLGQFAGFIFLLVIGTLLALRRGRDVLAGVLLAVATVKPQMTLFLILALVLWSLRYQRRRFIVSFLVTLGLLTGISFAFLPSWVGDFVYQVSNYMTYTATGPPVWVITRYYFPWLGAEAEITLSVLILLGLVYVWIRLIQKERSDEALLPMAMITLLMGELVVPRTATTNQIILFLPILWVLGRASMRKAWSPRRMVVFLVVTFAIGWLLFIYTHVGNWESPIMYLILPGIAFLGIVWDGISATRFERRREIPSDAFIG